MTSSEDLSVFECRTWQSLESELESLSDPKTKGDLFELFANFYFQYFRNLYDIEKLYCPVADGKPFPREILQTLKLERKDHGVDGVFVTRKGELVAWQAKFRSKRNSPTATELGTFWSEAEYADFRLVISNTNKLPGVAGKKKGHLAVLTDRFEHLEAEFFEQLGLFYKSENQIQRKLKSPRPYQKEILEKIREGFSKNDRGKVIAACGIGKTLISLWALEEQKSKSVLFFAPSLQLVRQTLEEWSMESREEFNYLCVCSDQSVDSEVDQNNINLDEIDVPVTTEPAKVREFLSAARNDNRKLFVFATYQSATVIGDAIEELEPAFHFDFAVFDEAHRTAGVGSSNSMSIALEDRVIPASKKLFLTATERLLRPRLESAAEASGMAVFSMNNERVYGPVFARLTFGEAIEKRIIADYRIVFAGLTDAQLATLTKDNRYIVDLDDDEQRAEAIQNLFKRQILLKVFNDLGLRKVITFHANIRESSEFARLLENDFKVNESNTFVSHINGAMSAQTRAEIIREFETSESGVISNVRCLTEGIDIPLIDGVFFADPKGSMIDIVQAVGRALRKPYNSGGKTSYIVVPVLLEERSDNILAGRGFESLFNLLQALRDQDHEISDWIDSVNRGAVTGREHKASDLGKIEIKLPMQIDIDSFADALALRIADVTRDPVGTTGVGSKLGKTQRKGSITRVFKTLMDYTPEKCETSLVQPTFERIKSVGETYSTSELKVNNNNVSHCRRLGLIREVERSFYEVTKLGKSYANGSIDFYTLFKNQMLIYSQQTSEGTLYPYRTTFNFLKELGSVNYIEFIYSLYSIGFDDKGNVDLPLAVNIAKDIRERYPRILMTSEANKHDLLTELNERYSAEFTFNNVWTDRTTAGNQYRYLARHLELFGDLFQLRSNVLSLNENKSEKVDRLLSVSASYLENDKYGERVWIE
jgi:superfamily II DNA or RNA helicase